MESGKINLAKLLLQHLNGRPRKEKYCENFSSFYEERENINQRCLLDEYRKKDGTPYFSLEEVAVLCPKFRQKENKCEIDGIIKPEEVPHNNELKILLDKFGEEYKKDVVTNS